MDALSLLIELLAKTAFLAMPTGVAWLAFRRLSLSQTTNAWIYAAMGLFAAFSATGLAPWALGFGSASWAFYVIALLCVPLWVAIVVILGIERPGDYEHFADDDSFEPEDRVVPFRQRPDYSEPLLLQKPYWPDTPNPLFRHRSRVQNAPANSNALVPVKMGTRPILQIARDMRGNTSTDERRLPVLLPPPEKMSALPDLPFLRRSS